MKPSECTTVGAWLASIHSSFDVYAPSCNEYGYEDTVLLKNATEDDLAQDLAEMGVKKNHSRIILNAVTELRADASTATNTGTPAPRKTLARKSSVKIDVEVHSGGAPASPPKRLQGYAAKTKSTDLASVQSRLSRAESLKEEETAAKVAFAATQNLQAEERKAVAIQQKTKFSRSDSLKVVETQAKNLIADAIGGKNAAALEARARTADERKAV